MCHHALLLPELLSYNTSQGYRSSDLHPTASEEFKPDSLDPM